MASNFESNLISVHDFTSAPIRIFNVYGVKMMKDARESQLWEIVFKWLAGLCLIVILTQASLYSVLNLGAKGTFIALTFNISCCGFSFLSSLKVYMIGIRHREIFFHLIDKIDSIFPKTNHEQTRFEIRKFLDNLNVQNWSYGFLSIWLFGLFNLTDISVSLFKYFWVNGIYERNLPYFLWFPWDFDAKVPIVFETFYLMATIGSSFCIFLNTAADLMFCSLLTLVCMEFDILRKKFEDFDKENSKENLAQLVRDHYTLIR